MVLTKMKQVAFIGNIIKGFFSMVIYMPILICHRPTG